MRKFFSSFLIGLMLATAFSPPAHAQLEDPYQLDSAQTSAQTLPQAPPQIQEPPRFEADTQALVQNPVVQNAVQVAAAPVDPMVIDGITKTLMAYPAQSPAILTNSVGIDTAKIDFLKFDAIVARQDYQEIYHEIATLATNRDAFNSGQFTGVSYYYVPPVVPVQPAYASASSAATYGTVAAIAAVGAAAAVAIGGGGGGGGSHHTTATDAFGRTALPDIATPASFVDTEMSAYPLNGLYKENAQYAWAKGLTGNGVNVGFYDFFTDDGSTHNEVNLRITSRNLNIPADTTVLATDCALAPTLLEACNHGVAVMEYAASERDGNNTVGMAYEANLLMYSVNAGNSKNLADLAPSIINYSCGNCATLADLQYIADKNILMTSATGNDGTANPNVDSPAQYASQLDYRLLAVTGIDDSGGTMTNPYDRCGNQMAYCLSAYSSLGTSFAAPQVAGAAAVIKQGWSFLTAKQIGQILLISATDIGDPGVDAVYGHGLLNLAAAVQPIGAISLMRGNGTLTGFLPSQIGQNQASPFGNAFANPGNAHGNMVVTDSFGRDFQIKPQDHVTVVPTHTLSDSSLRLLGKKNDLHTAKFSDQLSMQFNEQDNGKGGTDVTSLANYKMAPGTSMTLGFATGLQAILQSDEKNFSQANFISADVFKNGFVNMSDNNQVLYQAFAFNQDAPVKTKISTFYSRQNHEADYFNPQADQQLTSNYTSTMVENAYAPNDKTRFNIKTGLTHEADSVLGAKFSGGFDLADGASTYFSGLDASYDILPDLNLSASYMVGMTQVKPSADSAFSNVSDLTSDSFFVTATKRNLLDHDSLSFSIGQPTRVRSGTAYGLTQNVDHDTGAISTARFQQSLVPTGQTLLFQAAYDKALSDDISVNLAFEYTSQPYQQQDSANEAAGLAKLVYRFK